MNVAHLDIKPSNILITKKFSDPNNWSNWNAKICDFGLATDNLKSNSIRTDVQTTTLRYMVDFFFLAFICLIYTLDCRVLLILQYRYSPHNV